MKWTKDNEWGWITEDETYQYQKARYPASKRTCYYYFHKNVKMDQQHNYRHRADGPAIERDNGQHEWWYFGQKIECKNQEEFERIIKMKAFW